MKKGVTKSTNERREVEVEEVRQSHRLWEERGGCEDTGDKVYREEEYLDAVEEFESEDGVWEYQAIYGHEVGRKAAVNKLHRVKKFISRRSEEKRQSEGVRWNGQRSSGETSSSRRTEYQWRQETAPTQQIHRETVRDQDQEKEERRGEGEARGLRIEDMNVSGARIY